MGIYEYLSLEDRDLIMKYMTEYGGKCPQDLAHTLRFWEKNKAKLFHAFGDQFIIKREVCYEKSRLQLENDMYTAMRVEAPATVTYFTDKFVNVIYGLGEMHYGDRHSLRALVADDYYLATNSYSGNAIIIPECYSITGKQVQINSGCKPMKAIRKACKVLDIKTKAYYCKDCNVIVYEDDHICPRCGKKAPEVDCFEEFRQAHSMALNQKNVKGNLCISIHPMDFITMSDNASGWSSCMNWMGEDDDDDYPGEWRMGTIEMMNSPCVAVAYLEGSKPMEVCGTTWNNKRWRQLILVDSNIIVGNRQYPYDNDKLEEAALSMVRERVHGNDEFGTYSDTVRTSDSSQCVIMDDTRTLFHFRTNTMYNDLRGRFRGYFNEYYFNHASSYHMNFSGPAVCCACGDVIETVHESSSVLCDECNDRHYCHCCEEWFEGEAEYDSDGLCYCSYCWEEHVIQCSECGGNFHEGRFEIFKLTVDGINGTYWDDIQMCPHCFHKADLNPFGDLEYRWGVHYANIANVSNEVLYEFAHTDYEYELLLQLKVASTQEEKEALLRRLSFI